MKHTHKILISVAMAALVLVSLGAISAVSAASGSSANVQAPPLVGASIQGAPAVCSQDGTTLDLFVRGTDSHLYWLHSADGYTWNTSKAVDLNGICTSNPAATSPAPGYIDVFVRGDTGVLWMKYTTDAGATWTWKQIGGLLYAGTGPGAYSWAGQVGWFVTGTTQALWQQWSTNGMDPSNPSWQTSGWQNLGGILTSSPAATALSDGSQIGVVVGGTNSEIWFRSGTPSGWGGWTDAHGQLLGGTSPSAYNLGTSQVGWFVTGTTTNLYQQWAGNSQGYSNLGGSLTSSPGAVAKSASPVYEDVFARFSSGGTAALWQLSYNKGGSGAWGNWMFLGQVGP
jgi:hypothetical protein